MRTDAAGAPLVQPWPELHHVLGNATDKLTQQQFLERWPVEEDRPDRTTQSRWPKRAIQQGMICRSRTGLRGNPFLYWLPGREPLLWPGRNASEEEKQGWRDRIAEHHRRLREPPPAV